MNIIALKHFSFDDESAIASWANQQGYHMRVLDPSEVEEYPVQASYDMLLILGGPMSVYQEDKYPWLAAEKRFIRAGIDAGKSVLGICLGAQLLSEVLGGTVSRGQQKEIGWQEVRRTEELHPAFEGMPSSFISFQWHGDTFTLPDGAKRLAYSEACGEQAFAYGESVVGLQFHLEATPPCIATMLDVWSHELVDAPYIQPAAVIAAQAERSAVSHAMLTGILERMAAQVKQAIG
ncbi:type 1 glutamine amidotransferase [Paenibacillus radicis (ex Gao et al. 2016)]|uniref:Amidotransferase n=1 Tax=Paenibacillus radicis (ex Gao et al. 2016) TaxID=1737354 RepID=A0A917LZ19_9BACL|nr:type 1 glutamine amidotransferase [Paenibacillus radicis (ex Gao et al. 2016)]GGG67167.1 amidotransferase [Paenibacillus radicis (ex Gao et al. 2016)]